MKPITVHEALVLYSGMAFVTSGLLIMQAANVLGPRFRDHWTLPLGKRLVLWVLAIFAILRGVTYLFPGGMLVISSVPAIVPWWATAVLAASFMAAETLTSLRAPPAVMERVMSLIAAQKPSSATAALMVQPPATYLGEPLRPDAHAVRFGGKHLRRAVICGGLTGLLLIAVFVMHASAATPLPV